MTATQHNAETTKLFFDQWHLYQQIVGQNYMAHREIQHALRDFVTIHLDHAFGLLDLGCGDASMMARVLHGTPIQRYVGVDLSPVALEQAAQNLTSLSCTFELIESDFSNYLQDCEQAQFDAVFTGFALHHLFLDEKRAFLKQCYTALKPRGYLLLCDVFRRPNETRDEYLQAYCGQCRENWTHIPQETLHKSLEHIQTCDFPETYETMANLVDEAGFVGAATPLFIDAPSFHCVYVFQA